jgi:hypothetical protein
MVWIALKMLMGDQSKYFAIIFGVTFACFLIAEQSATFCGVMLRTTSQIRDVHGADIWVTNARPASQLRHERTAIPRQTLAPSTRGELP